MGSAVCSVPTLKPVDAPANASGLGQFLLLDEIMKPASANGAPVLPNDVLIVEDDPIIALDFEDTILGFGVKAVRTAGSVAKALKMIADRAPDFALLDVGLVREKSFAVAERLDALKIPYVFVTGYGPRCQASGSACGQAAAAQALFDRCAAGGIETPTGRRGGGLIRRYLSVPIVARTGRSANRVWDRAWSTTAPRRRDPARSPSSVRLRRRS